MKFVLAYTLCSAITGMCNTTAIHPTTFDSWSECAKGGAVMTIQMNNKFSEKFNKEKLYITYFCNQKKIDA